MPDVLVETKIIGQWREAPDWTIPDAEGRFGDHLTLRDLIGRVVRWEVAALRERQAERRLLRVLAPEDVRRGVEHGKVDSGGRDLEQEVVPDVAVGVALQGFEDGLYYVFVDGAQQHDLDAEVWLRPDSRLTFLRLTPLAGG